MSVDLSIGFDAFKAAYESGEPQLVSTRIVDDIETPVSAYLKLGQDRKNAFLLESVDGGNWRGRFSIIGLDPDLIWRVDDGRARIARGDDVATETFADDDKAPLDSLRAVIAESALEIPAKLPPPAAGLFGYLSYETVRFVEKIPVREENPVGAPDAILLRPTVVVIFDALTAEMVLATPVRPSPDVDAEAAYAAAEARLSKALDELDAPWPRHRPSQDEPEPIEAATCVTHEAYRAAVEKVKDYVRAGDIFQAVPSQRFSTPFAQKPFSLYRALRRLNPSPFLFFLNFGDFAIVGSSPEILVRVRAGQITIRPIAGTRPRGKTEAEDEALERELLADEKERAEHLMLLDLGRNDAGRVAKPGTVRVTDQFMIERYSHVMHIVSNVEAELREDCDVIDALYAGFPAGTVSGAPKVRAMEIIAELETERRGVYAGCVGYFSAGGDMDTCIALRTGVVADGTLHVRAGGGVVFDSDPESERMETVHKSGALFRAAAEAARYRDENR
ncbi:MAG: anthranilate synthase component I [Maricaulaceae bacterium]|jgi:anthranilate synthase component 1